MFPAAHPVGSKKPMAWQSIPKGFTLTPIRSAKTFQPLQPHEGTSSRSRTFETQSQKWPVLKKSMEKRLQQGQETFLPYQRPQPMKPLTIRSISAMNISQKQSVSRSRIEHKTFVIATTPLQSEPSNVEQAGRVGTDAANETNGKARKLATTGALAGAPAGSGATAGTGAPTSTLATVEAEIDATVSAQQNQKQQQVTTSFHHWMRDSPQNVVRAIVNPTFSPFFSFRKLKLDTINVNVILDARQVLMMRLFDLIGELSVPNGNPLYYVFICEQIAIINMLDLMLTSVPLEPEEIRKIAEYYQEKVTREYFFPPPDKIIRYPSQLYYVTETTRACVMKGISYVVESLTRNDLILLRNGLISYLALKRTGKTDIKSEDVFPKETILSPILLLLLSKCVCLATEDLDSLVLTLFTV